MRKVLLVVCMVFIVCLCASSVFAGDSSFAVAVKAGTLGGGAEGILRLTDNINARVGVNAFTYEYDGTESDIEYNFDLNLLTVAVLVDWFPFDNGFRLTGGLMVNQNELDATAEAAGSYTVGNTTYTSAQVGNLTGNIDFNEVAPYVGAGWGQPFGEDKTWTLTIDAGVMFQGSPNVDLSANGTLASNAAFLTDLEREENNLEDALDDYQYYPVVAIGVIYRF